MGGRLLIKHNRIIKEWFRVVFSRKYLRMWIVFAIALVVLIAVLCFAGSRNSDVRPEDTAFYTLNSITVGIVDGARGLAEIDENGEAVGFEPEFMRELISRIYPDKDVDFISIDSQIASYMLKNGEIDLAIGGFVRGVTKTQGLSVSDSYYLDGVYAYVPENSTMTNATELNGMDVLATTTEFTRTSLLSALEEINITMNVSQCSSYPDGIESVNNGNAAALIGLKTKMQNREGLKMLDGKLMNAGYSVLAWTDNSQVIELINKEIANMKEDGTLESLALSWGLDINRAENQDE